MEKFREPEAKLKMSSKVKKVFGEETAILVRLDRLGNEAGATRNYLEGVA
jgi:ATP-dependent Lon protease